ncbi:MAG TPA: DUF3379 family protein [Rhodanobacteraceae bacterium]|nr:DUF3379 family protein [Rhodanobacteraceae bacterium]
MDCLEFRRRLAAEPRSREAMFFAHRDSCHAGCTEAWWRAQRLERRIEQALSIEVPAQLAERILLAQATRTRTRAQRRWQLGFALAASVLLAVGIATFGWNRSALADPLPGMSVAHVHGEAFALARTQPVSDGELRRDFAARGVNLRAMPQGAVFARDCDVGPYRTVHLVFRINNEPVTALYFVDRDTARTRDFRHAGWQGRELPLDHGTLLLLGSDARGFSDVERTLRQALQGPAQQTLAEL